MSDTQTPATQSTDIQTLINLISHGFAETDHNLIRRDLIQFILAEALRHPDIISILHRSAVETIQTRRQWHEDVYLRQLVEHPDESTWRDDLPQGETAKLNDTPNLRRMYLHLSQLLWKIPKPDAVQVNYPPLESAPNSPRQSMGLTGNDGVPTQFGLMDLEFTHTYMEQETHVQDGNGFYHPVASPFLSYDHLPPSMPVNQLPPTPTPIDDSLAHPLHQQSHPRTSLAILPAASPIPANLLSSSLIPQGHATPTIAAGLTPMLPLPQPSPPSIPKQLTLSELEVNCQIDMPQPGDEIRDELVPRKYTDLLKAFLQQEEQRQQQQGQQQQQQPPTILSPFASPVPPAASSNSSSASVPMDTSVSAPETNQPQLVPEESASLSRESSSTVSRESDKPTAPLSERVYCHPCSKSLLRVSFEKHCTRSDLSVARHSADYRCVNLACNTWFDSPKKTREHSATCQVKEISRKRQITPPVPADAMHTSSVPTLPISVTGKKRKDAPAGPTSSGEDTDTQVDIDSLLMPPPPPPTQQRKPIKRTEPPLLNGTVQPSTGLMKVMDGSNGGSSSTVPSNATQSVVGGGAGASGIFHPSSASGHGGIQLREITSFSPMQLAPSPYAHSSPVQSQLYTTQQFMRLQADHQQLSDILNINDSYARLSTNDLHEIDLRLMHLSTCVRSELIRRTNCLGHLCAKLPMPRARTSLSWPCQHLCLCRECAMSTFNCPMCHASVQKYLCVVGNPADTETSYGQGAHITRRAASHRQPIPYSALHSAQSHLSGAQFQPMRAPPSSLTSLGSSFLLPSRRSTLFPSSERETIEVTSDDDESPEPVRTPPRKVQRVAEVMNTPTKTRQPPPTGVNQAPTGTSGPATQRSSVTVSPHVLKPAMDAMLGATLQRVRQDLDNYVKSPTKRAARSKGRGTNAQTEQVAQPADPSAESHEEIETSEATEPPTAAAPSSSSSSSDDPSDPMEITVDPPVSLQAPVPVISETQPMEITPPTELLSLPPLEPINTADVANTTAKTIVSLQQ